MTDQAVAADVDPEAGEEAAAPKPTGRMPGKKLVLFVVLPVVVLILGGAGAYVSGLLDSLLGRDPSEQAEAELLAKADTGPSIFFDLPEMLVNLNSSGRKTGYLKISVSLELGAEDDRARLEGVLPRVIDNFQVYLRELRVEDLQGSAGLQRLREELLLRVATAAAPAQVKDVLFREMLIQ